MVHQGDILARDFLKLEKWRQQLEVVQWQSMEGIRCRHAVEESQKAAQVEHLDRRLEHGEREMERFGERNQIIREQASLFQRQAGAQVNIPGVHGVGGAVFGRSEAIERVRDSREMFAGQVERMAGQWHQVIEDQMKQEIKMAREDSMNCKLRQNEMLEAACRQEQLLQELIVERRRMQEERSKMYSLDKEVAERNRALREKLELEREVIDTSLLKATQPLAIHDEASLKPGTVARRELAAPGGDNSAVSREVNAAPGELIAAGALHLQASKNAGAGASLLTSPVAADSSKGYVPTHGTRQFEVYQRLKQYENEMQSDLRLLEAAPLPVLLRETPVPRNDGTLSKQAFQPGTGAPVVVVPPPLPPAHLPPKDRQSICQGEGGGGTGDATFDESMVSRVHGVVEQSRVGSFHSEGCIPEANIAESERRPSAALEHRPSAGIERRPSTTVEQSPGTATPTSAGPLADLMAWARAPPRSLEIGPAMMSEVFSEPASNDVIAPPTSTLTNLPAVASPHAAATGSAQLEIASNTGAPADTYEEASRVDHSIASGNLDTPVRASSSGFSRDDRAHGRPMPPPLALDASSVASHRSGASPAGVAGFSSATLASSPAAALPNTGSLQGASTVATALETDAMQLPTAGHTVELLTSGTPLSTASLQAVVQDYAALQPGHTRPPTGGASVLGDTPMHSHLPAMTPFSPLSHSGDHNLLAYSGELVSSGEPNMDLWIPEAAQTQSQESKALGSTPMDILHAPGQQPSTPTERPMDARANLAVSPQPDAFEAQESAEHTTPSFLRMGSGSESVLGDARRAQHMDTLSLSPSAADQGSFWQSATEGPGPLASHSPQLPASASKAVLEATAEMGASLHAGTPKSGASAGYGIGDSNEHFGSGRPTEEAQSRPQEAPASAPHPISHASANLPPQPAPAGPLGSMVYQPSPLARPATDQIPPTLEPETKQPDSPRQAGWWRDYDTRPANWGRGSAAGTPSSLASGGVNAGVAAALGTPQSQGVPGSTPQGPGTATVGTPQSNAVGTPQSQQKQSEVSENFGFVPVNSEARTFGRQFSPAGSDSSTARRQNEALAAIAAGIDPMAMKSGASSRPAAGRIGSSDSRQGGRAPWDMGIGLQSGDGAAELDDDEVQGSESSGRLEDALIPARARVGITPSRPANVANAAPPASTASLLTAAPNSSATAPGHGGAHPAFNSFDIGPAADELSESEDVLKASAEGLSVSEEGSGSFSQKRRGNPLARGTGRGSGLRPGFLGSPGKDALGSLGSRPQDALGGASSAARGKAKAKAKAGFASSSAAFADSEFDDFASPSKTSSYMRPKAKAKSKLGSSVLAGALGGQIDWSVGYDPRW